MRILTFARCFIITISAGLLFTLVSCAPKGDNTVALIKHGKNLEYHLLIDQIVDSIDIKLSEIASDFEFIPLETKEECLVTVGNSSHLGEKYFVFEVRSKGIYQFSRDGWFIRKIVEHGKGPTEFLRGSWTVDEKTMLYTLNKKEKKAYKGLNVFMDPVHTEEDNPVLLVGILK